MMPLAMRAEIRRVRKEGICRARDLDGGNRFRNMRFRGSERWCRLASLRVRGSRREG